MLRTKYAYCVNMYTVCSIKDVSATKYSEQQQQRVTLTQLEAIIFVAQISLAHLRRKEEPEKSDAEDNGFPRSISLRRFLKPLKLRQP